AALDVLQEQPRRVERLAEGADALRDELARAGFRLGGGETHIVSVLVGDARSAARIAEAALAEGVFVEAVRGPEPVGGAARLRLAVMATHTHAELRAAARALAAAARRAGFRPETAAPAAPVGPALPDGGERPEAVAPVRPALFDGEAEALPRAA
ncbi:MAG TPA: aminotransferase class I/II-fold pyridoxal phosphate-dependent enzyme, partial [Solirubrobacteraceae bacterium]|nr:aminotransferase class I/II-fold pyridoxal phosphate-dependent enzyme [Solirubrobacteraceae bacterium]